MNQSKESQQLADALSDVTRQRIPFRGEFSLKTDWHMWVIGMVVGDCDLSTISKHGNAFGLFIGPWSLNVRYTPAHDRIISGIENAGSKFGMVMSQNIAAPRRITSPFPGSKYDTPETPEKYEVNVSGKWSA